MKNLAILMIALIVSGCGYARAGKWEDDAGNWKRAFQSTQPEDVVVVHSLYWRTSHWSFEAGYLFEIQPNEALRNQLLTENQLHELRASELAESERPCFGECPKWFAPKSLEDYEVWGYSNDPSSRFRVFIERSTGRIFVGDYQV